MLNKNFVILFLFSNLLSVEVGIKKNDTWKIIQNPKTFFSEIKKKKISIVIFTNLENSQNVDLFEKKLNDLENNKIVKEKNIGLFTVDYHKHNFFKNHFELQNGNYLSLFIEDKKFNLFEFDDYFDSEEILEKINEFLEDKLNDIIYPLDNMTELELILNEKKIIGIYLGKKNKDFQIVYNLALKFISNFKFVFSEDKNLKKKIFKKYTKDLPDKNVFVILRHKSLINKFDSENLILFSDFEKLKLKDFFILEKLPKILNCKKANFIKDLVHSKKKLIFHLKDWPFDQEKNNIFENFILRAPKKFIFASCGRDDLLSRKLLAFLIPLKKNLKNTIHLIYFENGKINIQYFNSEYNFYNIQKFVYQFYIDNQNLFELQIKEFEDENFINGEL